MASRAKISQQIEEWLSGDMSKTLGGLLDAFGEGSFAVLFVLLMALPALPLPTGGATHVLELVTMLAAVELIVGQRQVWLPRRWQRLELTGASSQKVIGVLLTRIRWLERFSRPRGQRLFDWRASGIIFGALVLVFTLTAFVAPPFSGLDTLPAIGVVLLALGFLLTDIVVAAAGILVGALGIAAVLALGRLTVHGLNSII